MENHKVVVVPCSGIGKSLGTVGRVATYKVIERMKPEKTRTVCLALLTMGDDDALKLVRENPCIAVDGCPAQCSKKNIEASMGKLAHNIVVTDVLRKNRSLKPDGVIELNDQGNKLAEIIARALSEKVDEILREEKCE
ncbi:putative zinc-binding protein [Candidatus Bathyarchaeota archaeon]|nr:putative zinc-binding protein [Candidatus Bathyarchaeota archaeon]